MPKVNKVIMSLGSGELSPLMDARLDQQKYQAGCRIMENFIPLIYGGAQERPGLEYIATQKSNSAKGRLVAFEHSVNDTYILLFENQVLRFFKNSAQINGGMGTEDISSVGSIIAHWLLNDNLGTTVVLDDDGGTHSGTMDPGVDTSVVHKSGKVGSGSFDFDTQYAVRITDNDDFSFDDSGTGGKFSIAVWVYVKATGSQQHILSKWDDDTDREWAFYIQETGKLVMALLDETNNVTAIRVTESPLSTGWHFVVSTYDSTGGNTAANGITLYVDGAVATSIAENNASYVRMRNTDTRVTIGALYVASSLSRHFADRIDNVAIFSKEISSSDVTTLWNSTTYEIITPYLSADLLSLKMEQSADVLFITHPSYETRKLSRFDDAHWELNVIDIEKGPFRDQNADVTKTIISNGTTGSVTLTATGHNPFVSGTSAGHSPNGVEDTDKSQTGALFKLVQATAVDSIDGTANGDWVTSTAYIVGDTVTESSIVYECLTLHTAGTFATDLAADKWQIQELVITKGITWDFTTQGTWTGTIKLQREYNNSDIWETVHTVVSVDNKNVATTGTEDFADAKYRINMTKSDTVSEGANVQLSIRDTSHIGIVKITSVINSTSAVATVLTTLASTDKTHRWSEGSFSNRRGWPIDVAISSEERLTFAGNISEPLTTWGSVIGDFTDFIKGSNDDDALNLTLVGSGQQNRIRWILSKNVLVMGTVGGEHLLGASRDEEALTPSNIKAKLQTTYGSEDIAALIVNQAVIFVQRGGRKIREFLYEFESDSFKADDLTVFAEHITESGIVTMAFQRTPDPMLWCVRSDGEMAIMTYERDQNIFSWARFITQTNLSGTKSDSDFESAAIIYGGAGNEDEVWVTVRRTISGVDVRYIERFFQRKMPTAIADMKYLDSFITYSGGTTTATGLGHLIGQTVQVLGDGVEQSEAASGDFQVTGSGEITLPATFTKVQIGLGYDATVKPMKIDLNGLGLTITKKINRGVFNFFETIKGKVGTSTSRLHDIPTGTAALFTGSKEIPLSGGYSREGDIIARQTAPLPMTILSFSLDIGSNAD